jgi:hypothetical protein
MVTNVHFLPGSSATLLHRNNLQRSRYFPDFVLLRKAVNQRVTHSRNRQDKDRVARVKLDFLS